MHHYCRLPTAYCLPSAYCLSFLLLLGCAPSTTTDSPGPAGDLGYDAAHDGHGHAHDHTQAGPHGGHLLELGEEQYHIEWLHDDDTGLLTMYVLDGKMEEEVPIRAPAIKIERTIGDEAKTYQLLAADTESGTTARFEATDKSLIEALKLAGQGVRARLTVEIEGEVFTAEFEHAAH